MMCSHTPDTTMPIAKPENPLTKPPTKAAQAKRVKTNPSMGRILRGEVASAWMDVHLKGEAADPCRFSQSSVRELAGSLSALHHFAAICVERVIDDPLGRIERVVVLVAEVAETFGDRLQA